MIYCLSGKLAAQKDNFFVLETEGGVGYKIFASAEVLRRLPELGQLAKIFSHLHVREDCLDLYGFLNEAELEFFEKLIGVNGVGPKSALGIMNVGRVEQLTAAIMENKAELLTRASGIGRKTAERIILELKGRLTTPGSARTAKRMTEDIDLEEALVNLGYGRSQSREAIGGIDSKIKGLENRLREALRRLKR